MEDDRLEKALARIEAASTRIEAAATRAPVADESADPALQARYDRLREEAAGAVAQIDALIETLSS
ncbi:hypothetical protein [Aurantiacibacter rhizosphaerae]|uniref:Uncharacterized protein n=1 Tax=Aurantiacibacter rhizosphaerae TaxID=2691582 RepID=A0A844XE97_9SPHN|nr:hypothetical protein [Aurantiacibacter rhizosphaerae]MWV28170.1 hypothetical protein [Aurantiacibacter rhizosphaerae]